MNFLIAPPRIKEELSKGVIQNTLFGGPQGTGKTSSMFLLTKDYTTLYINASSEGKIDTIRDKITKFCSTISLEGGKEKLKVVLLDEMDGVTSDDFFNALRAVMERFASVARFICTCNYKEKIPEPVLSRFNVVSFYPINEEEETYVVNEYKKRISIILTAAKIEHNDQILDKFIKNDFPDLRSMLNKIQSFYTRGIKELNDKNFNINYDFSDLFDLVLSKPDKPYENYKFIIDKYASKIDDAMVSFGHDFIEYLKSNSPNKIDKIPLVLIATAEGIYQKEFSIDKIITLLALIFKLQTIINN